MFHFYVGSIDAWANKTQDSRDGFQLRHSAYREFGVIWHGR